MVIDIKDTAQPDISGDTHGIKHEHDYTLRPDIHQRSSEYMHDKVNSALRA